MKELFSEYPYLSDDRVILRRMTPEDAGALRILATSEIVYRYLPTFLYEQKYEDANEVIARMDEECFDTKDSILLAVCIKSDPQIQSTTPLVGIAEIYNYEERKAKASIGYRLHQSVWGQGIATRVIGLLKDYLINEIGLRTITAHIMCENGASARAVQKNGFLNKYPNLYGDWGFPELTHTDKYVFKREWMAGQAGDLSGPSDLTVLTDHSRFTDSADHTRSANRSDPTGSANPTDFSDHANHFDPAQPVTTLPPVQVEQFVMAYQADHDRIRAMLPKGFTSLRPVLRINAEIRNEDVIYIEFNTPVEAAGRRGWLNIANWKSSSGDDLHYAKTGQLARTTTTFTTPFLTLRFTATGTTGGCPAEKDNEGCYFLGNDTEFRPAEKIEEHKEFCDCEFAWRFHEDDAYGVGNGESRPVTSITSVTSVSPTAACKPVPLTAETAAAIPCEQVLGAYTVRFQRYGK